MPVDTDHANFFFVEILEPRLGELFDVVGVDVVDPERESVVQILQANPAAAISLR